VNWKDREASPLELQKMIELGTVESLPLSDILREIQKPSQNLYTDLLLAHLGETSRTKTVSVCHPKMRGSLRSMLFYPGLGQEN